MTHDLKMFFNYKYYERVWQRDSFLYIIKNQRKKCWTVLDHFCVPVL